MVNKKVKPRMIVSFDLDWFWYLDPKVAEAWEVERGRKRKRYVRSCRDKRRGIICAFVIKGIKNPFGCLQNNIFTDLNIIRIK